MPALRKHTIWLMGVVASLLLAASRCATAAGQQDGVGVASWTRVLPPALCAADINAIYTSSAVDM